MTHTYTILVVTPETYAEIRLKLLATGYEHAFQDDHDDREIIDMHGIALKEQP